MTQSIKILVWKQDILSKTGLTWFYHHKKQRALLKGSHTMTFPSIIQVRTCSSGTFFLNMWINTLKCMCGEGKKSLLSSLKRYDPSWPGCQWSIQEGSNGAGGSEDSQGGWESTAELSPHRFLAVSLCLLTLSYSIDFFINPLSKCFSLPHSTDISPPPPTRSWFSCSTLW